MISVGSISRAEAARRFYFLEEGIRGRRKAINELTHKDPDFVFWIYPDGRLFDAKDAHIRNYPKDHKWILDGKPDYSGFLRGGVATGINGQVIAKNKPSREGPVFSFTVPSLSRQSSRWSMQPGN